MHELTKRIGFRIDADTQTADRYIREWLKEKVRELEIQNPYTTNIKEILGLETWCEHMDPQGVVRESNWRYCPVCGKQKP